MSFFECKPDSIRKKPVRTICITRNGRLDFNVLGAAMIMRIISLAGVCTNVAGAINNTRSPQILSFHSTKLPLTKWFWAIYWVSSDKGGISALRLTKLIGVSWPTARLMLKKLRETMGHRDSLYRLSEHKKLDVHLLAGSKKATEVAVQRGKSPS